MKPLDLLIVGYGNIGIHVYDDLKHLIKKDLLLS